MAFKNKGETRDVAKDGHVHAHTEHAVVLLAIFLFIWLFTFVVVEEGQQCCTRPVRESPLLLLLLAESHAFVKAMAFAFNTFLWPDTSLFA